MVELADRPAGGVSPNPCPVTVTVGAAVSPAKLTPLMTGAWGVVCCPEGVALRCAASFGPTVAAATAATASPATATGTHLGNSGTTTRVPGKRAGASGFGGSATIEKVLGSGLPTRRHGP